MEKLGLTWWPPYGLGAGAAEGRSGLRQTAAPTYACCDHAGDAAKNATMNALASLSIVFSRGHARTPAPRCPSFGSLRRKSSPWGDASLVKHCTSRGRLVRVAQPAARETPLRRCYKGVTSLRHQEP